MSGTGCCALLYGRFRVALGHLPNGRLRLKNCRRWFVIATVLTACSVSFPQRVQGQQTLVLNTAFGPPISTPKGDGFFDQLMREAFGRYGITVSVDRPPAERALINANAGIVDGDGPRIPNIDNTGPYPNLIRVPEKLFDVEFAAFTNGRKLNISKWEDLKNFNVGIVRGWKILEHKISQSRSLVKIKTAELLFRMLMNGRVDVVVADRLGGLAIAEKLKMETLLELTPLLAIQPMYLYLNRKHSDLVPKINLVLSHLRKDGTYTRLFQGCVNTYIPGWVPGK